MKKKMLTIDQYLLSKEISKEVFDTMAADEVSNIYKELNEENILAFKELQDNGATSKELAEAVKAMTKENADRIEKVLLIMDKGSQAQKEQGLALAKLLKGSTSKEGDTVKSILVENKEAIINIAKRLSSAEITIKADTNLASVVNNTGAFEVPGVGQLGHKKLNALNAFPIIPISGDNMNSTLKYIDWDEATTVRAATEIAEGGTFPESTAKWQEYTLPIRKIGDTLPVTEEFMEDESRFAVELELFLRTNVDIELDDQVINGDGTGQELTGLVTSTPAYVPASSGISDASIYDLIVKVSEDITTDEGSKYTPNVAFMNIADINEMKLKKDANDNYVTPPFSTDRGQVVDGIVVIEDNHIVANTMVLGDRNFARMYQAAGVTVSTGLVDAQFAEDMMTLKVRRRIAFLIREADKSGWRKVTNIAAALVTLAT